MSKIKDITGQKFGKLVALELVETKRHATWKFKCDCGNIKIMRGSHVVHGSSRSCGCVGINNARERLIKTLTKHNLSRSRFRKTWEGMRARCEKSANKYYPVYGGRGIAVCESWRIFQNFIDEMYVSYMEHAEIHGEKNTYIDRIDNDEGYNKENCKWSTILEQANNRRNNRFVEFNGDKGTVSMMARKYGYSVGLINTRLRAGWSVERAFSQPVKQVSK